MTSRPERQPPESIGAALGGRRGLAEASLPPVLFVVGWWATGHSVWGGVVCAVLSAVAVAGWRLARGHRPVGVLIGLLGVCVAALVTLRTGRAADYFLLYIFDNAVKLLIWPTSIALRWPLLGLAIGGLLRQGTRWRRDPDLLRAYTLGTWVWVPQYVLRVVVFVPLYLADQVWALAVTRVVLGWPLAAVTIAATWWVIRRSLPPDRRGLGLPRPEPADG